MPHHRRRHHHPYYAREAHTEIYDPRTMLTTAYIAPVTANFDTREVRDNCFLTHRSRRLPPAPHAPCHSFLLPLLLTHKVMPLLDLPLVDARFARYVEVRRCVISGPSTCAWNKTISCCRHFRHRYRPVRQLHLHRRAHQWTVIARYQSIAAHPVRSTSPRMHLAVARRYRSNVIYLAACNRHSG